MGTWLELRVLLGGSGATVTRHKCSGTCRRREGVSDRRKGKKGWEDRGEKMGMDVRTRDVRTFHHAVWHGTISNP